jgi:hypothetical protein
VADPTREIKVWLIIIAPPFIELGNVFAQRVFLE